MKRPGKRRLIGAAATLSALLAGSGAALAHHPMGGTTPQTLWHGLLSGFGHPVIGPDHLAFIVAIGIAAGLLRGGLAVIAAFIVSSTAGVLVHVARLDVPLVEPLVALSVLVAGALLALGGHIARQPGWTALAAVAGLLHGYAFGETVVGAERGVMGAYLVGLAVIMSLIAWSFMHLTQRFAAIDLGNDRRVRIAGVALGCVGLVLLVGNLVTG
jgi:urease accessory protein